MPKKDELPKDYPDLMVCPHCNIQAMIPFTNQDKAMCAICGNVIDYIRLEGK